MLDVTGYVCSTSKFHLIVGTCHLRRYRVRSTPSNLPQQTWSASAASCTAEKNNYYTYQRHRCINLFPVLQFWKFYRGSKRRRWSGIKSIVLCRDEHGRNGSHKDTNCHAWLVNGSMRTNCWQITLTYGAWFTNGSVGDLFRIEFFNISCPF